MEKIENNENEEGREGLSCLDSAFQSSTKTNFTSLLPNPLSSGAHHICSICMYVCTVHAFIWNEACLDACIGDDGGQSQLVPGTKPKKKPETLPGREERGSFFILCMRPALSPMFYVTATHTEGSHIQYTCQILCIARRFRLNVRTPDFSDGKLAFN